MSVELDAELQEALDKMKGTWAQVIADSLANARTMQESLDPAATPYEQMISANYATKIIDGATGVIAEAIDRQKAARGKGGKAKVQGAQMPHLIMDEA